MIYTNTIMRRLTRRQLNEKNFHDKWAGSILKEEIFFEEAFRSPTASENRYILSKMGNFKSKNILDLGCGVGDASIYFAKKGAYVKAVDISPKMVLLVRRIANLNKLSRKVKSFVMAAEDLRFPKLSFDFVYGNGILHHVDFIKTAYEIKKVLKRGGQGFFIEPLSYNPLIETYRKLANGVRTVNEKPLSINDIEKFGRIFKNSSHQEFHFFTLLIFIWFFLGRRLDPNKIRYWKIFLKDGHKYKSIFNFLYQFDRLFLKYFPFMTRFCWTTVITIKN